MANFSTIPFRAVSLAGESDRKLLKEVVKDAPCPVKSRVIPQGKRQSFVGVCVDLKYPHDLVLDPLQFQH